MSETHPPASAYTIGEGDPIPRHRRNPRRGYDRQGFGCRPMDLANAMQNGVLAIRAICPPPCRHEGELAIDRFPSTMAVRDVGLYLGDYTVRTYATTGLRER